MSRHCRIGRIKLKAGGELRVLQGGYSDTAAVRDYAHGAFTTALAKTPQLLGVVVIAIGRSGYAIEKASDRKEILDIDLYGRASTLIDRQRATTVT